MTTTAPGTPTPSSAPAARKAALRARAVAALRPGYQADLADGTERFFEPRRADCPWCGSTLLRVRLRTSDLLQHKPGRFVLDECRACGHVFQNPRLTGAGLEFYYRDFYDGLGEQRLGTVFGTRAAVYRGRARSVTPFAAAPDRWLDVGTGHGHFCERAREVFPETVFDGLDLSEGVELAEQNGRLARGFRGSFPELAPAMAGRYDVLSMFHYLEHSTDPARELAAAREALRPGGLLLIEVPDPRCRYARLLGRWWLPWLQPQHLNLVPAANLRRRLGELGFTVLLEQHHEPHDPVDLLAACWLLLDAVAPREDAPWLPGRPPGRLRRLLRGTLFLAGAPVLLLATALDRLIARFAGRAGLSNAYRLLARYEARP
ncbi:class I SAM-dependent methyltransferase [Kitasatospora sp. NBC_01287]|uniref:class I SAM-dependent methyltransferase n=1 Tax=Kitasatospora sp. NBC_01287 TaxID=2903573 RepID=UPI002250B769|nr:class I SAM-dependent methyltransferase [Kitasatospora sp. NBC_01287]MCX4751515.1 class I SAM-dependent methyltransferase [Kitasatospora sp. NBC_01287]